MSKPKNFKLYSEKPSDVIDLKSVISNLKVRLDYGTTNNFTGTIVPGYQGNTAFLTESAAQALKRVSDEVNGLGYGLIVFDSYRPFKAVKFFFNEWRKLPEDKTQRDKFFPKIHKEEIFLEEYLSEYSSHCRCSTLDLSLYSLSSGETLDMGTIFDYLDEASHTESPLVSKTVLNNRMILKNSMEENGFVNYSKEWWHFRFKDEPYPDTYFDFDIN